MTRPKSIAHLLRLIVSIILAGSTVLAAHAQTSQIAQSLDGEISIQLPTGWVSRDTANPTYTSALAFGDTAQSLQRMIDSLTQDSTPVQAGMNGIVGIINPQLFAGMPADQAVSALMNSMNSTVQQLGGTLLDQQSFMLGGQYPASIALVSIHRHHRPQMANDHAFGVNQHRHHAGERNTFGLYRRLHQPRRNAFHLNLIVIDRIAKANSPPHENRRGQFSHNHGESGTHQTGNRPACQITSTTNNR